MTLRQAINKQKRGAGLLAYIGLLIFAWGLFNSIANQRTAMMALAGLALSWLAIFYILLAVRCPKCRGPVGASAAFSSGLLAMPKKVKFCPYCGVDIDSEIVAR
jgi:hypothetical protein